MQVYKKMCMRGIEATDTTYTALISAYAKAERLDDALAAYQIMVRLFTASCRSSIICRRMTRRLETIHLHTVTWLVQAYLHVLC